MATFPDHLRVSHGANPDGVVGIAGSVGTERIKTDGAVGSAVNIAKERTCANGVLACAVPNPLESLFPRATSPKPCWQRRGYSKSALSPRALLLIHQHENECMSAKSIVEVAADVGFYCLSTSDVAVVAGRIA